MPNSPHVQLQTNDKSFNCVKVMLIPLLIILLGCEGGFFICTAILLLVTSIISTVRKL